jgi:hypothetical protein
MLNRLINSLGFALLGFLAVTGTAHAQSPDRDEIVVGTFLLALGLMFVLLLVYLAKRLFGLEQTLPPEADAGEHH